MITYIEEQYSSTNNPYEQMNIIELSLQRKDLWNDSSSWENTLQICEKKLIKLYSILNYYPFIQNKIDMWYKKLDYDYDAIMAPVDFINWEYKRDESEKLGLYKGIVCKTLDVLTLIKLRRMPTIWNMIFGY